MWEEELAREAAATTASGGKGKGKAPAKPKGKAKAIDSDDDFDESFDEVRSAPISPLPPHPRAFRAPYASRLRRLTATHLPRDLASRLARQDEGSDEEYGAKKKKKKPPKKYAESEGSDSEDEMSCDDDDECAAAARPFARRAPAHRLTHAPT